MTFPTGWTKRTAITIPAAQVGSGGVSSFTVLFTQASINANSQTDLFANAKSDGSDLRVSTDSAGTNLLTVDVIEYDAVGATFVIRVGTLTLSATVANTLYLWWGNSAATAQTGSGAYDSDWVGYWPDGGGSDRTLNGNDGSAVGGVSAGAASGKVGDATAFDGTNDTVTIADDPSLDVTELTFIAWVRKTRNSVFDRIAFRDNDAGSTQFVWGCQFTNSNLLEFACGPTSGTGPSGNYNFQSSSTITDTSGFHQIAATYASGTSTATLYIDGSSDASGTPDRSGTPWSGNLQPSAGPFALGRLKYAGVSYFGAIDLDDVHFHSVPRSAAWMETEYNQTNAPASFASSGNPVTVGVRRRSRWAA